MKTNRVVLIGCGPRGISILEQLAIKIRGNNSSTRWELVIIDAFQPGAGRIWRSTQSTTLLMNTVTSQVTMYSGGLDDGPWRPGAGPTFHQWLAMHKRLDWTSLQPNDYAPRYAYGHYLQSCFGVFVAALSQIAQIEIICDEVTNISWEGGNYSLALATQGERSRIDAIILATGHGLPRIHNRGHTEAGLSRYILGDSAADLPLGTVNPHEHIGIIGLGLGFYDIVTELTAGRGGHYSGCYHPVYTASGSEPVIIAGSRSGVPLLGRGLNQKLPGRPRETTFISETMLDGMRLAAKAASGYISLDFNRDIAPRLQAEMDEVYYGAVVRQRYGDVFARKFNSEYRKRRVIGLPIPDDLVMKYNLRDVPPFDMYQLARPFIGMRFDSQSQFDDALLQLLENDTIEALEGNVDNPSKAACDILRDVRDTIRLAVEFDGLTPESRKRDFLNRFAPACSLLSAGPPLFRIQQLRALIEAGIVVIAGPEATFVENQNDKVFTISSPFVRNQSWTVKKVFDSRIPTANVIAQESALFRQGISAGLMRPYKRNADYHILGSLCTSNVSR